MSMKADIDSKFDEMISEFPANRERILILKFSVYESLDWDSAAVDTVREILNNGYKIDGNMASYLDDEE